MNRDFWNQDPALFINITDKLLDLLNTHSQLHQNVREISVTHISQNRKEFTEIIINPDDLQIFPREISSRDGVFEIEETEFNDILLIEKILNFHFFPLKNMNLSFNSLFSNGPAFRLWLPKL